MKSNGNTIWGEWKYELANGLEYRYQDWEEEQEIGELGIREEKRGKAAAEEEEVPWLKPEVFLR